MASWNPAILPAALATSAGWAPRSGTGSGIGARPGADTNSSIARAARYRDRTPRVKTRPRSRQGSTHEPMAVASTGVTTNGTATAAPAVANGSSSVVLHPSSLSPTHQASTKASTAPA